MNSPRLLLHILLLALCVTGAGCVPPEPQNEARLELNDRSAQITPKPYTDEPGAAGFEQGSQSHYAFGGDLYRTPSAIGQDAWTREEVLAASFIHSGNVYFHFDSRALTTSAKEVLKQKALKMKVFPQLQIIVAGHSDERGSDEYNFDLGSSRAQSVFNYLVSIGVPSTQLDTISYGKMYPVAEGSGEDAWSLNRRVEFLVAKPR